VARVAGDHHAFVFVCRPIFCEREEIGVHGSERDLRGALAQERGVEAALLVHLAYELDAVALKEMTCSSPLDEVAGARGASTRVDHLGEREPELRQHICDLEDVVVLGVQPRRLKIDP